VAEPTVRRPEPAKAAVPTLIEFRRPELATAPKLPAANPATCPITCPPTKQPWTIGELATAAPAQPGSWLGREEKRP